MGATANILFKVFLNLATLYSVKVYNVPLPTRTLSVFLRKGTNDFAQIVGGSEKGNEFANYKFAMGVVGIAGSLVTLAAM